MEEQHPTSEASVEEDYDPFLHRTQTTRDLTYGESVLHCVKSLVGVSLIASAEAVSHAGYMLALITIPIIWVFDTCLLRLQVRMRYHLCRKYKVPYLSYRESLERCLEHGPVCLFYLAKISSVTVDVLCIVNQIGTCAIYIMFFSYSMEENFSLHSRFWMMIFFPILVVFVFVNDLKSLVPYSIGALLLQVIGMIIILIYIIDDLPSFSKRDHFKEPLCWTIFFVRTFGASESVAVFNTIEKYMKKPADFTRLFGVLNTAMLLTMIAYYTLGILGYIKYGPDYCSYFLSSGALTTKLPRDDSIAVTGIICYSIGLFLTYGLTCFPAHYILWNTYVEKRLPNTPNKYLLKYVLRMTIIVGTFAMAVLTPDGSMMISLILRTFCLAFLGVIAPAVLYLCSSWPNNLGPCYFKVWLSTFSILVGLSFQLVAIFWAVMAIKLVIEHGTFNAHDIIGHQQSLLTL